MKEGNFEGGYAAKHLEAYLSIFNATSCLRFFPKPFIQNLWFSNTISGSGKRPVA